MLSTPTSVYEGEFANGLKNGVGKEKFLNGDRYEGEYEFGKPNGEGIYYWYDGSYYKGLNII